MPQPPRHTPGPPAITTRRTLLLGAALPFARPAPARAAPVEWRLVTEYPATAMPGEGVTAFAAAIAREAPGTLTIHPGFDAPDGLRSAAMPAAVSAGRVEAADAFTGALAGTDPLFQLSSLPFLAASDADAARLWRIAEPAYRAALESRGLLLLYATPWPPTGLWSRRPLSGPAALSGLRVRTYDAASTAVLAAAGAAPVQLSFADAAPRLRDGSLDAVLSSGDGGAGARLWEVLPHFTVLDYAFPLSLAFCAHAAFDALPSPAQAAITAAGPATTARQFAAVTTRVAENEARIAAQGVTISRDPALRTALAAVSAPVVQAWQSRMGEGGTRILQAFRTSTP